MKYLNEIFLLFAVFGSVFQQISALTKVIVPSVYKEWKSNRPLWVTSPELQRKYNYTVFMYQKHNSTKANFISKNRGTEGGVYLRFIVDHYHKFPDIAVFVHADPEAHQPNWLGMIGCVHENATYSNLNNVRLCRDTSVWARSEIWVEQCWRDVLRIAFGLQNNSDEFNRRVPTDRSIWSCGGQCCQQFIISRAQVHKRPLSVWKEFLKTIGEQNVCHIGEPDYDNLYAYKKSRVKVGPEPSSLHTEDENNVTNPGFGRHTQGMAMEHLAHVVYGLQSIDTEYQDNNHYCANYLPKSICPGSPCNDG